MFSKHVERFLKIFWSPTLQGFVDNYQDFEIYSEPDWSDFIELETRERQGNLQTTLQSYSVLHSLKASQSFPEHWHGGNPVIEPTTDQGTGEQGSSFQV